MMPDPEPDCLECGRSIPQLDHVKCWGCGLIMQDGVGRYDMCSPNSWRPQDMREQAASSRKEHAPNHVHTDYSIRTLEELCKLAQQRGLLQQAGPSLGEFMPDDCMDDVVTFGLSLQAALRVADQGPPFRFLDLPPELRERIYHYLLTPTGPEGYRHQLYSPQILAACRQTYNEGHDILYDGNASVVRYEQTPLCEDSYYLDITVDGTEIELNRDLDYDGPGEVPTQWPKAMLNFTRLQLWLCLRDTIDDRGSKFNRFVYDLASFLSDSTALREIRVHVQWIGVAHDEKRVHLLKALSLFRVPLTIISEPAKISQDMPLEDLVQREINGVPGLTMNKIPWLHLLKAETNALECLQGKCCEYRRTRRSRSRIWDHIKSLQRQVYWLAADAIRQPEDRRLTARMSEWQHELQRIDVRKIIWRQKPSPELREKFRAARVARRAHKMRNNEQGFPDIALPPGFEQEDWQISRRNSGDGESDTD